MANKSMLLASLGPMETSNRNLVKDHDRNIKYTSIDHHRKTNERKIHSLVPIDRQAVTTQSNQSIIDKKKTVDESPRSSSLSLPASDLRTSVNSNEVSSSLLVMEKLRLKLKEFEIENDQLRRKQQYAEETIKSLKTSLSNDGSKESFDYMKRDASTQTKRDPSQEHDISSLRQHLESTEQKLILSLTERDHLLKSLSDVSRELNVLQSVNRCTKEQYDANDDDSREKIRMLEATIKELTDTNTSLSSKHASSCYNGQVSHMLVLKIKDIYHDFQSLKREHAKLKATVEVHSGINIGKQNASSFQVLESKVVLLHKHYNNKIEDLSEAVEASRAEVSNQQQLLDMEIQRSNSLSDKLSNLERIYQQEVSHAQSLREQLESTKLSDSSNYNDSLVKINAQDQVIHDMNIELKQVLSKSEQRGVQIQSAKISLFEFQEKFRAEIQACRHDAHVKDLTRVANIREISLERDKVLLELQSAREVTNILSFSLKTMEQSLSELNPELITKLVEGRNKRLKELERHSIEKIKDLDQRSAETNSVSSTHLDAFKEKAVSKLKIAQEESKKQFDTLNNTLLIS